MKYLFCGLIFFLGTTNLYASWEFNKGRKHILYGNSKNLSSFEKDVFDERLAYDLRWKRVAQVAENKKKKEAVKFLTKCMDSKKWFLQIPALKFLKEKYPHQAVKEAKKVLFNSKALVVRSEAVEVLKKFGSKENSLVLWRALNEKKNFRGPKSLWVRPQIVEALMQMEHPDSESPQWNELKTDSDPRIRKLVQNLKVNL